MKNKTTVSIVIGLVLFFFVIFLVGREKNNIAEADDLLAKARSEAKAVSESSKKEFNKISVDDYLNLYNGNKDVLIFVGSSSCNYCQIAEPIVQNIMFIQDIEINYISTDEFTEESEEKFMSSNDQLNSFSTPLIMVVSNGKIKDSLSELTDSTGYFKFFVKNGFIEG